MTFVAVHGPRGAAQSTFAVLATASAVQTDTAVGVGLGVDVAESVGVGVFVTVGANGTILTSPDGSAWTPRSSGSDQTLRDVTWSGARFVAVGDTRGVTAALHAGAQIAEGVNFARDLWATL